MNLTQHLSLYTAPVAWLLCFAPHYYAIKLHDRASPVQKFDKVNPRAFLPSLDANQSLDLVTRERIARAEAASLNSYENLGFFAAAVVAANVARVDEWWLNVLSIGYLASRAGFCVVYVNGVEGFVRGGFFYWGIGSAFALFVKAGNAVRRNTL